MRIQDQVVVSYDELPVVGAVVPVDLEVAVDLLRRDLVVGGEVVELAEGVVEGLKRVVVVGVHAGEVQLQLLALVLDLQRGERDDYLQAVEAEGREETAVSVVDLCPEPLQDAVVERPLLLVVGDLDVPGLVLDAPVRVLRAAVLLLLQRQEQRNISVEIEPQGQLPPLLAVALEDLLHKRVVADLQVQVAVDDSAALLQVDVSDVLDVEADQRGKIVLNPSLGLLQGLTGQAVAVLVLQLAEVLWHLVEVGEDQRLLADVLQAAHNAPGEEAALEQSVEGALVHRNGLEILILEVLVAPRQELYLLDVALEVHAAAFGLPVEHPLEHAHQRYVGYLMDLGVLVEFALELSVGEEGRGLNCAECGAEDVLLALYPIDGHFLVEAVAGGGGGWLCLGSSGLQVELLE